MLLPGDSLFQHSGLRGEGGGRHLLALFLPGDSLIQYSELGGGGGGDLLAFSFQVSWGVVREHLLALFLPGNLGW